MSRRSADDDTIPTVTVEWAPLEPLFTHRPSHCNPGWGERVIVEYGAHSQVIRPCNECVDWEAHVDVVNGLVVVREWHHHDCTTAVLVRALACHGELDPGTYCADCGTYNPNEPAPEEL